MPNRKDRIIILLAAGDAVVLALVTLVGFASHGELVSAGLKLLTTFLPLCVAWAVTAPWLGLFTPEGAAEPRQLWRPLLAAFIATPLAGWLRGLWLGADIIPTFVLVVGASSGLGLLIWRGLWALLIRRQVAHG